MSEIGLLVKVPAELHGEFKRASARHQRSMQKVVLALLEGWIENGAPDPLIYGSSDAFGAQHPCEDTEAREALLSLAAEVKTIERRLARMERPRTRAGLTSQAKGSTDITSSQLDSFAKALRAATNTEKDDTAPDLHVFSNWLKQNMADHDSSLLNE